MIYWVKALKRVVQFCQQSSSSKEGIKWVVTPADKVRYDDMFEKADSDKDGYVNGAEIKGIFLKSGLQQQVLARIWLVRFSKNLEKDFTPICN